jgi:hypothetical protein
VRGTRRDLSQEDGLCFISTLKGTHHETKLHNLKHLPGWEGGPCPRSSLNASHHSKNNSTSIISEVSKVFGVERRMKLNAFQTRTGTGSTFPT